MDTREMEIFLKVADYRSVTKVAKEFGMSQPAVSAVIKRVEELSGTPLFLRRGRQLTLNQAGSHFYQMASAICRNYSHIRESLAVGYSQKEELIITMSVQSDWLLRRLDIFTGLHREIGVTLRPTGRAGGNRRPWMGDFMVLFQHEIETERFLTVDMQDTLFAIMPPGHPLAGRDVLHLNELKNENFIFVRDPYSAGYEGSYEACVNAGFLPRISLVTDSNTAKYACIQNNCGIGLVFNNESATAALLQDCVLIPIRNTMTRRPICLAWQEGCLSPAGEAFLSFIQT